MKRAVFSIIATVLGIVGLLSFKTHGQVSVAGGLPSAGLPASPTSAGAPTAGSSTAGGSTAAAAPPHPSSAAAKSVTPVTSATAAAFTGAAENTRYGVVQVKITVLNKKITNVAFVQLTSYDGHSQDINSQAAPILLQETLAAQNAQINTVSGASYTSQGYLMSLQSALDQAGIK